jgi:hypothetical protein
MKFKKVELYTNESGYSQFRELEIELNEAGNIGFLSDDLSASNYQLRHSPIGYKSDFHNSTTPQWVFILSGTMRIGLRDGTHRDFKAGESFYSNDTPPAANVAKSVPGHNSAQVGSEPLQTLFLRVGMD